jgi:hypothetical protein
VGGLAPSVTNIMFRRTGRQFFLKDSDATVALASAAAAVQSHAVSGGDGGGEASAAAEVSAGTSSDVPSAQMAEVLAAETPATFASDLTAEPSSSGSPDRATAATEAGAASSSDALNGSANTASNRDDELPEPPAGTSVPPAVSHNISFLLQLAFDIEGGPQFISALAAFASRTCYANADGDHLVGWANSSLRFQHELPALDAHAPESRVTGVAHEDAVEAAFACRNGAADGEPPATILHDDVASHAQAEQSQGSQGGGHQGAEARQQSLDAVIHASRAERAAAMLRNLKLVPWGRVDCSWRGARVRTFAHNHIQVTRAWVNMAVRTHPRGSACCLVAEGGAHAIANRITVPVADAWACAGQGCVRASGRSIGCSGAGSKVQGCILRNTSAQASAGLGAAAVA